MCVTPLPPPIPPGWPASVGTYPWLLMVPIVVIQALALARMARIRNGAAPLRLKGIYTAGAIGFTVGLLLNLFVAEPWIRALDAWQASGAYALVPGCSAGQALAAVFGTSARAAQFRLLTGTGAIVGVMLQFVALMWYVSGQRRLMER